MDPGGSRIVPAPDAPAGAADPTRRWALRMPDGAERFPGVTRTEGAGAAAALAALEPVRWDGALVEVVLPVVLSDGAGPYLLDRDGRLTLVLGAHRAISGAHVAMGAPSPGHAIGAVERRGGGLWEWLARVDAGPDGRVRALDGLDACADAAAARRWASDWRG